MGKNNFEWLDNTGSSSYSVAGKGEFETTLEKKIAKFLVDVAKGARKYKLIGTGKLASQQGYRVNVIKQPQLTQVEIFMLNYGMFQNFGVKGIKSHRNAPNSPYKFKTWGMPQATRDAMRSMVMKSKQKTRNVKYEKVGLEGKNKESKDPVDVQVADAVYKIKKFGIKTKPFFTEAFEKHFGTFDEEMIKAIKKQFVTQLTSK